MLRIELEELDHGDKKLSLKVVEIQTVNQYINSYQISICVQQTWDLITNKEINKDNNANILPGKVIQVTRMCVCVQYICKSTANMQLIQSQGIIIYQRM